MNNLVLSQIKSVKNIIRLCKFEKYNLLIFALLSECVREVILILGFIIQHRCCCRNTGKVRIRSNPNGTEPTPSFLKNNGNTSIKKKHQIKNFPIIKNLNWFDCDVGVKTCKVSC